MSHGLRTALLATIAILGLLGPRAARGDLVVSGGFGPNGDLGFLNSPPNLAINYGGDGQGSVYQMNGYVSVQGGGTSADLGDGAPPGLGCTFNSSQPTTHQLLLTYQFTNNSGSALAGFQFLQYTDPDVGTGYPSEYATVNGASSLGVGLNPTSFQASDASFGTILTNIGTGMLSNNNDLPSPSQVGDVAFALGFNVGTLGIGQTATFNVMLSDDGSSLGGFSITEVAANYPGDGLTFSGAVVPEPSSLVLVAIGSSTGLVALARRRAWGRAQAWTRSQ